MCQSSHRAGVRVEAARCRGKNMGLKAGGHGEDSRFGKLLLAIYLCCSFFNIFLNKLGTITFLLWEAVRIKGDDALSSVNWNFKET